MKGGAKAFKDKNELNRISLIKFITYILDEGLVLLITRVLL